MPIKKGLTPVSRRVTFKLRVGDFGTTMCLAAMTECGTPSHGSFVALVVYGGSACDFASDWIPHRGIHLESTQRQGRITEHQAFAKTLNSRDNSYLLFCPPDSHLDRRRTAPGRTPLRWSMSPSWVPAPRCSRSRRPGGSAKGSITTRPM